MTTFGHDATTRVVPARRTRLWSVSQFYALVLGAAAIAFGALALAHTGVHFGHVMRPGTAVLGFTANPLLGMTEIAFGVLLVLAATSAVVGRGVLALTGAATVGVGIVVLAGWWGSRLALWLFASDRDAWLFVAVGCATVLMALFTPVWAASGRTVRAASAEDL
jgi:hypothetical protein